MNNTVIVGDFNTPVTSMERSPRQNIKKSTEVLNDTIDQLNLIDTYRTPHPKKPKIYILPKCAWNGLQNRPHNRSQNKPQQI